MSRVPLNKGDFWLSYDFGVEQAARIGQAYVPGLPTLPIDTERYTIRGGGSQSLQYCIQALGAFFLTFND